MLGTGLRWHAHQQLVERTTNALQPCRVYMQPARRPTAAAAPATICFCPTTPQTAAATARPTITTPWPPPHTTAATPTRHSHCLVHLPQRAPRAPASPPFETRPFDTAIRDTAICITRRHCRRHAPGLQKTEGLIPCERAHVRDAVPLMARTFPGRNGAGVWKGSNTATPPPARQQCSLV